MSTCTTKATATKAFATSAHTSKSATNGATTATDCIHSNVYRSFTMESPMVDVLETCRRVYSEHAAIVNAKNYHWERVWNMMNYMADRLKVANRH